LTTIGLVGSHTDGVAAVADIVMSVPAENTARAPEAHRTVLHALCELIEDDLAGPPLST